MERESKVKGDFPQSDRKYGMSEPWSLLAQPANFPLHLTAAQLGFPQMAKALRVTAYFREFTVMRKPGAGNLTLIKTVWLKLLRFWLEKPRDFVLCKNGSRNSGLA